MAGLQGSGAPGGSFGGFGMGAHPSSSKGGGQWSVGKSTAPRQPPRPAEAGAGGGLYVPPLTNAGPARRPPPVQPQQAGKQLAERSEGGLFVPPDPGVSGTHRVRQWGRGTHTGSEKK